MKTFTEEDAQRITEFLQRRCDVTLTTPEEIAEYRKECNDTFACIFVNTDEGSDQPDYARFAEEAEAKFYETNGRSTDGVSAVENYAKVGNLNKCLAICASMRDQAYKTGTGWASLLKVVNATLPLAVNQRMTRNYLLQTAITCCESSSLLQLQTDMYRRLLHSL